LKEEEEEKRKFAEAEAGFMSFLLAWIPEAAVLGIVS